MSKSFTGLDFIKLVGSLMVVIIHTKPFGEFSNIIPVWAVPFFFSCSGFFFGRHLYKNGNVTSTIKKLILFYVSWSVIYMPLDVISPIINETFNIKKYLLDFFLLGSHYHLWFLNALLFSYILILLIKNHKILIILSLVGLIFGVIGSSYYELAKQIPLFSTLFENYFLFDNLRRFVSLGLPFTVMGYLISKNTDMVQRIFYPRIKIISLIVFFCYLLEIIFVYLLEVERDVFITFLLLPFVFIIFIQGLIHSNSIYQKTASKCRSISSCVYFIHPWIIFILYKLCRDSLTPIFLFIFTSLISILIGYIIIKINNSFLNRLIA